mmetsp:Transcript_9790/g.12924  ORF Transcript_9790/g.12924 Transcript_9790/m.12924 type:complete len:383 (-) Transcript_9790:57-1205(-)
MMRLATTVVIAFLQLFEGHHAFSLGSNAIVKRPCHQYRSAAVFSTNDMGTQDEAERLLQRAREMRAEIAALEGRTVTEVEAEAKQERENRRQALLDQEKQSLKRRTEYAKDRKIDGSMMEVPETFEDQVVQARVAVERAFRDGVTRQTIRFELIPEGQVLNEDRQWPGGAQEMYREAAGPLTRELLKQVKAPTKQDTAPNQFVKPPTVKSQDIWDFDGSALITAESSVGPSADVQAMVLPNTDVKYTKDIATINEAMGDRLFLLVNPFWRDLESWGFNIMAPNAKKMAQDIIFDKGYDETYVLLKKSVRGEDCVCLKAYPYDWQLYAYADDEYWPNRSILVRLGSTKHEPKATDFAKLLEKREEFKMSKNMRQMQRLMNKDK